jgi:cytochrome oxidase Cu insertion factor (SCO1/SenC/PrrC family)
VIKSLSFRNNILIHKAVLKVTETVFNLKVNIMVNHKKIISAILLPFFLLGIAIVFLAMNPEKNSQENIIEKITEPQPEELGKVKWLRNYDQAIAQSDKNGKPVLILFQEVPGYSTCRNYGNNA